MIPTRKGARGSGRWLAAAGLCALLLSAAPALADDRVDPAASPQEDAEEPESESEPPNTLALFLGNTNEEQENGFSIGLEYEHELAEFIGVGAIVERASGDIGSTVALLTVILHPFGGFDVILGLGVEFKDAREEHGEEEPATSGALGRIGVAYAFKFGRFAFVPQVNLDFFQREEALVVGAAFAYKF